MKKFVQATLSVIFLLLASKFLLASWIGKGEVVGEVINSRIVGESVVFDLTIDSQTNELFGSVLGSPNTFSFSGSAQEEISSGDRVKLRVNSSDKNGIHVEQIEFIENKPGIIEKEFTYKFPILLTITIGIIMTFFLVRKIYGRAQRRQKQEG